MAPHSGSGEEGTELHGFWQGKGLFPSAAVIYRGAVSACTNRIRDAEAEATWLGHPESHPFCRPSVGRMPAVAAIAALLSTCHRHAAGF